MSVELIGLITVILVPFGLLAKAENTAAVMGVLSMLVAAAALSVGPLTINPALLFLPIFAFKAFLIAPSWRIGKSGVFFLLFLLYSFLVTFFAPRFFADQIQVVWSARDALGSKYARPLAPGAGNITQTLYAVAGAICFFSSMKIFEKGRLQSVYQLIFIVTGANIIISIADFVGYYAGMKDILSFIRNGNYVLLTNVEFAGIKRMTGSFTEASFFATYNLVLLALNFSLFTDGIHRKISGFFALTAFFMIVLSVSTTGYVGLAVYLLWMFGSHLLSLLKRGEAGAFLSFSTVFLFCGIALSTLLYFINLKTGILDQLIFDKMDSQSGIERSFWNRTAWNSFLDSYGLGIGFGSTRASSFLLVLLSNTGLAGTILYFLFITKATRLPSAELPGKHETTIVRACRKGVVANLIGALLSSTVFDLGFTIYLIAGISAGILLSLNKPTEEKRDNIMRPNSQTNWVR